MAGGRRKVLQEGARGVVGREEIQRTIRRRVEVHGPDGHGTVEESRWKYGSRKDSQRIHQESNRQPYGPSQDHPGELTKPKEYDEHV